MREKDDSDSNGPRPDNSGGKRGRRSYFGGDHRQAENTAGIGGRDATGSPPTMAQMRGIIDRSTKSSRWADAAIIFGAFLLVACIVTTLILASGINARANRIIEGDRASRQAGVTVVERLEGKLDEHIVKTEENGRKLDALLAGTTTTTTAISRTQTATTAPKKVVAAASTSSTSTTTTTIRRPTTTTTTLPPCRFALLSLCLLR